MLTFVINMLVFLSSIMPFGSFEFTAQNFRDSMKDAVETVSSIFTDLSCINAAQDHSDRKTK